MSSGSTGASPVIFRACPGVDRDRIISHCADDVGDTDPGSRSADMHSVLVTGFPVLLKPDVLHKNVMDIFQPHPPPFCRSQSDPLDGGLIHLVKCYPEILVDLCLPNLVYRVAIQFCTAKAQNMQVFIAAVVSRIRMEVADDIVRNVLCQEQPGCMKDKRGVGRQDDRLG